MFRTIINTPWPKLFMIAGTLGSATALMGLLAHRQREKLLERTPFLKKSLELIKQEEVIELLGTDDPSFGRPSLNNPWSRIDDYKIKLIVPIKGVKDKAMLYVTAERKDIEEKYRVTNLYLEFKKIKGKKLVVLDENLDEILAAENKESKQT